MCYNPAVSQAVDHHDVLVCIHLVQTATLRCVACVQIICCIQCLLPCISICKSLFLSFRRTSEISWIVHQTLSSHVLHTFALSAQSSGLLQSTSIALKLLTLSICRDVCTCLMMTWTLQASCFLRVKVTCLKGWSLISQHFEYISNFLSKNFSP